MPTPEKRVLEPNLKDRSPTKPAKRVKLSRPGGNGDGDMIEPQSGGTPINFARGIAQHPGYVPPPVAPVDLDNDYPILFNRNPSQSNSVSPTQSSTLQNEGATAQTQTLLHTADVDVEGSSNMVQSETEQSATSDTHGFEGDQDNREAVDVDHTSMSHAQLVNLPESSTDDKIHASDTKDTDEKDDDDEGSQIEGIKNAVGYIDLTNDEDDNESSEIESQAGGISDEDSVMSDEAVDDESHDSYDNSYEGDDELKDSEEEEDIDHGPSLGECAICLRDMYRTTVCISILTMFYLIFQVASSPRDLVLT